MNFIYKTSSFKTINLNFGPQHPSAHGVLRLILEMQGEFIKSADPHIGLLHRGTEKLLETKTFLQGIPYFDRLDYVSMLIQEHAFCLAVEKLSNSNVKTLNSIIRVLFSEITRILNHLMSITTHALDVGALTPFLWGFEEREKLMGFYEAVSGARMHAAFFRPGGVYKIPPFSLLYDIALFSKSFISRLNGIEVLLSNNRIWKSRLIQVAKVTSIESESWTFSGPMLRSTGIMFDLRKSEYYESYNYFKFKIPLGLNSDCFDRYLVRIEEMRQSALLIQQALSFYVTIFIYLKQQKLNTITKPLVLFDKLLVKRLDYFKLPTSVENSFILAKSYILKNSFSSLKKNFCYLNTMESLILHFKLYGLGLPSLGGTAYAAVESPKGEFGVLLTTEFLNTKPYRCKIKSPGLLHLQGFNFLAQGHLLADAVTIIGTQDIVFGEIDR